MPSTWRQGGWIGDTFAMALVRVDARWEDTTYEDEGRMEDAATRTEDQRARSGLGSKPEGVADIRQAKGVC